MHPKRLLLFLLIPGLLALTHPELRFAAPAPDASLRGAVQEVQLTFSEPIDRGLSRIAVYDEAGSEIPGGAAGWAAPEERDRLIHRLDAPLPPGRYRVDWRTAAADGHIVQGTYSFRVEEDAPDATAQLPPLEPPPSEPPPTAPPPAPEPPTAPSAEASAASADQGILSLPAGTSGRWLHLIAVVLLLGAVFFRLGVVDPLVRGGDLPGFEVAARSGAARAAWSGILLLAVTLVLRLAGQLAQLGEGAGDLLGHLLFRTGWGTGWFLHLAAVVIATGGLALAAPRGTRTRGWRVAGLGALLLPLSLALQGHAWSAGDARAVASTALYFHVLAAGIWLGGLWLLLAVGLPAIGKGRKAEDPAFGGEGGVPAIARLVNGFSRLALLAVLLLILTGGIQSYLHLGDLTLLFTTSYGRILLLKYAGVAGILLLGFYNWRRVRPALAANPDPGQLRIPASIEAVIGLLVLAVTSVLVAMPLP